MFSNLASYIFGGSNDEEAIKNNEEAFNKVRLFNSKAKLSQNERLAAIIFIGVTFFLLTINFPSLALKNLPN